MKDMERTAIGDIAEGKVRLTHHLEPYAWDPERQVVVMADGSVAKVLECLPSAALMMSGTTLEAMSDRVAQAMQRFAPNTLFQLIMGPTPEIDDDLQSYLSRGGTKQPLLQQLEMKKVDHFRDSRVKPLLSYNNFGTVFTTKRFRCMIIVAVAPTRTEAGIAAGLIDTFKGFLGKGKKLGEQRLIAMLDELTDRVNAQTVGLINNLRAIGVETETMGIDRFLNLSINLMYPDSRNPKIRWDPEKPLNQQISQMDIVADFDQGIIEAGTAHHMIATLARLPPMSVAGHMSMPHNALGEQTVLDFVNQGFICIGGTVIDRNVVRERIQKRRKFVNSEACIPDRRPVLNHDIDVFSSQVENEGRAVLWAQTSISMWDRDPTNIRRRMVTLKEQLMAIHMDFRIENHAAPSIWLQSMPCNLAPGIEEARRAWWMPDRAVAQLMPIYGMSRGTKNADFLAHNRLGEPVRWSFFDSNTNPNFVVIGASGSGKSFFANNLIVDFLRKDGRQVFIVDKGRSYIATAGVLGKDASVNVISEDSRICTNPCEGALLTAGPFLIRFIDHLVSKKESERLSAEETGLVNDAISKAFMQKRVAGVRYTSFKKLMEEYPGCWIDEAWKRMRIRPLDDLMYAAVDQAKGAESGRQPVFKLLRVGRLVRRSGSNRALRSIADIDENDREWLDSRRIEVTDGEGMALVLYQGVSQEEAMKSYGFEIERVNDYMFVDIREPEDVETLMKKGVSFDYPQDFLDEERKRVHEKFRSRYPEADEDRIVDLVNGHMENDLSPLDLERCMEGMAVIQREVFLSDIYIEMKGNDKSEKAMDIARRLESYVGKGAMAGFFDGKTSYDMNARLVCWETAELAASGPHLLAAVVGAMIQKVLNHVQEPSRRGNQRMLVLEEFWQLLKVDLVAETVENMYRTSRKFGLAVGIVTQSIEDLTGPPGASGPEFKIGQAIINAANHRMILMQPQNIIANTERTLAWPMEKRWMLSTVRSKKDAFSEIMYECNDTGMCDVMRLIPYPFLMWMSTTANDAVRYRDRTMREILAEDKTKTPTEALAMAIERCSKQFPNGMS